MAADDDVFAAAVAARNVGYYVRNLYMVADLIGEAELHLHGSLVEEAMDQHRIFLADIANGHLGHGSVAAVQPRHHRDVLAVADAEQERLGALALHQVDEVKRLAPKQFSAGLEGFTVDQHD